MSPLESVDFRIQELAAGFSLGDITEAELLEIKSYDQEIFQRMVEKSDEAAARAFLTFQATVPVEPMPVELSARLKKMALGFFDEAPIPKVVRASNIAASSMGLREITAWLCTAASIALALSIWLPGKTNLGASLQQQRD